MKVYLAIFAVILCAQALPTDIGKQSVNATGADSPVTRSFGFASFGGGTRGGQGGAIWTVWDPWALRDAFTGNEARVINVRGRIDLTLLFTDSPGVMLDVGSWKTLIGGDSNAEITGGGLRLRQIQQVIIQNIKFKNALSYAPGEFPDGNGGIISMVPGEFTEIDAIDCWDSQYVWIDHNEFSDDPWIADNVPENMMRHDGLLDIKRASNWVTVSHNIFRNHNKVILVGHSDNNAEQDAGKLKTTFVGNWFMGTTQRNPRVRFGEVHVLNNLYTDISYYAIGVGVVASIYAEANTFINTIGAWRFPVGTPDPMGYLLPVNNLLVNSTFASDIPSEEVKWVPSQYYDYTALSAKDVEAYVKATAGTWK